MIKVLEHAIDKIRELPEDRQAYVARVLEALADEAGDDGLTPAEIEGIEKAQAEIHRGEYADTEVAAFYRRIGV